MAGAVGTSAAAGAAAEPATQEHPAVEYEHVCSPLLVAFVVAFLPRKRHETNRYGLIGLRPRS
jgi:hypothetical protein